MKVENYRNIELSQSEIEEAVAYWLTTNADKKHVWQQEHIHIGCDASPDGFGFLFKATANQPLTHQETSE